MKRKSNIITKQKITLTVFIIILIVLIILLPISNAILTEEADRIEELRTLDAKEQKQLTLPVATMDFVQPYLFSEYSEIEMIDYVKTLKRAGYEELIVQNIMNIQGGKNSEIVVTAAWYDSNLIQDSTTLELYRPKALETLIKAVQDNNMKVYIGLASSNDWWSGYFTDDEWRTKNINFFNDMINEIYQKYGNYKCFEGIYWPHEIYTNGDNYYGYWSEMINSNIEYLQKIDIGEKKHAFMISPFISQIYELTYEEVNADWKKMIEEINFRKGDIICIQDGLGTSSFEPTIQLNLITALRDAIKSNTKGLEFWLNVENYANVDEGAKPSTLERYKLQLSICSKYAEKLVSFSYSHYYNPSASGTPSFDKQYRQYYTSITGEERHKIPIPKGGSVYEDENGKEAPLPKGFEVSETENKIDEGLVIIDESGNRYVWIPVSGEIPENQYPGVNSNKTQIEKYGGFYVKKDENTPNYNSENFILQIDDNENSDNENENSNNDNKENENNENENDENKNTDNKNLENKNIENTKLNNTEITYTKIDKTITNTILPKTGKNNVILMLIIIALILTIISFIKYKRIVK